MFVEQYKLKIPFVSAEDISDPSKADNLPKYLLSISLLGSFYNMRLAQLLDSVSKIFQE